MTEEYGYMCALRDVYEWLWDLKDSQSNVKYNLLYDICKDLEGKIAGFVCSEKNGYRPGPTL